MVQAPEAPFLYVKVTFVILFISIVVKVTVALIKCVPVTTPLVSTLIISTVPPIASTKEAKININKIDAKIIIGFFIVFLDILLVFKLFEFNFIIIFPTPMVYLFLDLFLPFCLLEDYLTKPS